MGMEEDLALDPKFTAVAQPYETYTILILWSQEWNGIITTNYTQMTRKLMLN